MSRAAYVLLLAFAASCSSDTARLFVTVRTDWVPGVEFGGASVRLDGPTSVSADIPAFVSDDYASGVLVAALTDLSPGTHHLVVTLHQTESGDVLDEASLRVDLNAGASLPVTVVLTRQSRSCTAAAECASPVACVEGTCVDGSCLYAPRSASCAAGEYCDPDQGCTMLPAEDGGMDAGTRSDASTSDGGSCSGVPVVWHRSADWMDGTAAGATDGNPAPDSSGRPTWYYEMTTGGPLGAADEWFAAPPTLLLWDDSWYGGSGVWARADDYGPVIDQFTITHTVASWLWTNVPRVRWQNPLGSPVMVTVSGTLELNWGGETESAPMDIDVVIARLDASGAALEELFAATIPKPTPDTSRERTTIMVPPSTVVTDTGESIIVSLRGRSSMDAVWMDLVDDLSYLGVPCE